MTELLSPVGNMSCLIAAINAGCDAVYLSGINFGARSFAGNFTNDEILTAIKTCHLYGVKIYITVNTLIYEAEVERFMNYIDFLHKNNVDAVIMQDIGMIDLVRKTYPNLEIHASTQMFIHNMDGVEFCKKIGIKRVVLARETPIELIKKMKKANIELEVFIQGALCMSYSGQCLMSSLIGNRSGNRGTCAQPCRQKYSLEINNKIVDSNSYLLSTKDLNTLEYIDEFLSSGIDSLKIEGRMKSKEYVYLVTSLYRKAIDNYKKFGKSKITKEDINNLKSIFNREFTKGFLFNENNDNFTNTFRPNHMGTKLGKVVDIKNNRVYIKLIDSLSINDGIRIIGSNDSGGIVNSIFKNNNKVSFANKNDLISIIFKDKVEIGDEVLKTTNHKLITYIDDKIKINKKIGIDVYFKAEVNSNIKLIFDDGLNKVERISNYVVEEAKKSPTTKEQIINNLTKLGNSIYKINNMIIDVSSNIFIPINIINELRRVAVDKLNNKRLYKTNYLKEKYSIELPDFKIQKCKNILINNYEEYIRCKDKFNIIYTEDENLANMLKDNVILKLPRVNEYLKDYNKRLLVSDLGSVYKYKNIDCDFSFNVFNSYSVAFLHSIGVNKITLSLELNYKQIKQIIDSYESRYKLHPNLEVIIDCFEEVMVCKYNLLKNYNTNEGYLIDRFNNKYKIIKKHNLMYIYNYQKRDLKENYFDIGINNVRINL
ncbi:MAG: DUF3656 domain-containing protein [bacterium]|nr:DUF3656 domain-containing protein [bacterium]